MRFKAWRGSPTPTAPPSRATPWTIGQPLTPGPSWSPNVLEGESFGPSCRDDRSGRHCGNRVHPARQLGSRHRQVHVVLRRAARVVRADDLQLAGVIAAQVAFAVERTRARRGATERGAPAFCPRCRLDGNVGLGSAHRMPCDGPTTSRASRPAAGYVRWLPSPVTNAKSILTIASACSLRAPRHRARRADDVEYRMVAPDGTVRWVEGKGRVEYHGSRPVRMSGVCLIVTRRKEAELARLASAEEASRLKDEFLATLSHELRTPLNAILGWVQIVKGDALPPERIAGARASSGATRELQAQLIEDILDVSRIISGKLEIDRAPVHAVAAARRRHQRPAAGGRGQGRFASVASSPTSYRPSKGTRSACSRSSSNVLSNAIKFTPDGGTIAVTCESDGDGTPSRSRIPARDRARVSAVCLRSVPPGRQPRDEKAGRPRPRACNRPPHHRGPRRHD